MTVSFLKLTFGEFVYDKRKTQGIAQKQITDELSVTTVYICDIKKNPRHLLPRVTF